MEARELLGRSLSRPRNGSTGTAPTTVFNKAKTTRYHLSSRTPCGATVVVAVAVRPPPIDLFVPGPGVRTAPTGGSDTASHGAADTTSFDGSWGANM
eukprot:gene7124-1273_t